MIEADDGLELDYMDVFTRQRLREKGGINYPHALLGCTHTLNGSVTEIAFTSIANLARFVEAMCPQRVDFYVGQSENVEDLKDAIAAGAVGQLH